MQGILLIDPIRPPDTMNKTLTLNAGLVTGFSQADSMSME
jgi:hypothetical protein